MQGQPEQGDKGTICFSSVGPTYLMMDVTTTCFYYYLGNVSVLVRSRDRYGITAQGQVFRCGLFQVNE